MSWQQARDALREVRASSDRSDPKTVVANGKRLINENSSSLGKELYEIMEQVTVAALDCGDIATAADLTKRLQAKFGATSNRVRRLEALVFEASGQLEQAQAIYDGLLAANETDASARKRLVAIAKARGHQDQAIALLVEHLSKFHADWEAWSELADLYLNQQTYDLAAFTLEELLLLNPTNDRVLCRYAECRYSQGGKTNLTLARQYFRRAVESNPRNTRACYGVVMAASALLQEGLEVVKNTEVRDAHLKSLQALLTGKFQLVPDLQKTFI